MRAGRHGVERLNPPALRSWAVNQPALEGECNMDDVQAAKAPVHLWIVGFLSLLWNGFGCYDYLMTRMRNLD
jgi:hypothetical protein